ncbi:DHA2 family efflux MFS transporter permease subunit [Propionibacterium australiense]|nr:DHA2 family efflux MFS transporter permease subunit [Propionibacterium australiense]SYZ34521.1 Tetracycline resistance protein TetB signature [Propionibacterium australiense]VEH89814.1 Multidrug resistance protein B [Propionibacterium australiense]
MTDTRKSATAQRGTTSTVTVALLVLAGFLCIFNEAEMNIALPTVSQIYGVPVTVTQWLTTGYMLVTGTFMPLSAFAMGRFGSRRCVLGSLGILLVGILVSATSSSFPVLLAGRLLQALGAAFFIPVMMAVVITVAPRDKLGTYNGLMMLVLMAAPALSPTISGVILSTIGLRWTFLCMVPLLVAIILCAAVLLKEVLEPKDVTVDALSVALSIIGFGGAVFAVGNAASAGFLAPSTLVPLAVGAVAIVVYARRQLRARTPLLNLRILANRRYRTSLVMIVLVQMILFGTILVAPLFLQSAWGYSASQAGLIMLPGGVVTAVANLLAGMIYDRFGTRAVPFGLIGSAVGYLGIAACMAGAPKPAAFVVFCAIYSGALPFAMTALTTNGLGSLNTREYPDGSSLNNTLQQIGGSVGTAVFTIVVYHAYDVLGEAQPTPLVTGSIASFVLSAAGAMGLLAAFAALRKHLS